MGAFAPFDDFDATEDELRALARARDEDRYRNLSERLAFFAKQDAKTVQEHFAFVPQVQKTGFGCCAVPAGDGHGAFVYSVGYYYSFRYPELMLLADTEAATFDRLAGLIQHVGVEVSDEDEPDEDPKDETERTKAYVERAGKLVQHFAAALPRSGLATDRVELATPAVLQQHPYGYGWYFYRHFLDDASVPILVARVR